MDIYIRICIYIYKRNVYEDRLCKRLYVMEPKRRLVAAVVDLCVFFIVSLSSTVALSSDPRVLWVCAPVLLSSTVLNKSICTSRSSTVLTRFKIAKVVSAVLATVVVNVAQSRAVPHELVRACLAVNILEASAVHLVTRKLYAVPALVCSAVLVSRLWWMRDGARIESVANGRFPFPLPHSWILSYTLWNVAFVYDVGFSLSFGLILVSAYVSAVWIQGSSGMWLSARTYSLLVNQWLRGTQPLWIYVPNGESIVTDKEGDNTSRDRYVGLALSVVSLCSLGLST